MMALTYESRAEIWDAIAAKREANGDTEGAARARFCAKHTREPIVIGGRVKEWGH